ncbi:hypothetical protein K2173_019928 [Erythroxylum novogranatense]|uniref:Protein kinase domain-containing protein n=1 Tax=Erythroxylum novogranatense TaxID=1862640 RepID=A0AAV8U9T6_9ROSI|nr:hypothetical protein K2173_019928 [Erythroxylum novogranatense]
MMNCNRYLLPVAVVVLEVFLLVGHHSCSASKNCNSTCGDISIRLPFRLRTDPKGCGYKSFELDCEDNHKTVLYLSSSAKYYVREINYTGFSIRVVDNGVQKDNCSSLPRQPLTRNLLDSSIMSQLSFNYDEYLVFVRCVNPVAQDVRYNSDLLNDYGYSWQSAFKYIDTSSCNYSASYSLKTEYSYVIVSHHGIRVSDLEDLCHVERTLIQTASDEGSLLSYRNNLTYKDVHDSLLFGFHFSFHRFCCYNYDIYNPCSFEGDRQLCKFPTSGPNGFLILRTIHNAADFLASGFSLLHKFGKYHLWRFVSWNDGKEYPLSYYDDSDPRYWISWLFVKNVLPRGSRPWQYNYSDPRYWIYHSTILRLFIEHHILLFIFGSPFVVGFLIYKWKRRHLSMFDNIEEFLQTQGDFMPIRYSYSDIKKITKNFKDKLGQGGYGSVYKGRLRSGCLAAIKLLGNSKSNGQDFINEVGTIGTIHHVNVVKLIGFCVQGSKRALVYEFMPNGSLDKYLFSPEVTNSISMEKMYEISLGVARGIEYLHRGCAMQILHFDIKPHNILLDENFAPKVSDFGIAKLCETKNTVVSLTCARGTIGYMAPELCYRHIGGVSFKADVYSFGMLLMEMAGKRKNLNTFADHSSQIYFPAWAYEQFRKGKYIEFEEDNATEEQNKITKKIIMVALWCIQLKPDNRPPMHKVIEMLEQDVESLELLLKALLSSQVVEGEDTEMDKYPIEIRDSTSDCSDSISLTVKVEQ